MSGLVLLVELLDNLQKWIYRTVGASLAACLEPSDQRRNAASLSLSIGITLVDAHLNVTRVSMATFSFLIQLNTGIFRQ